MENVYFEVWDILHEKTMTDKQISVVEVLQENFDMPTKEIIEQIERTPNLVPSERLVQKVRKEIRDIKTVIERNDPLNRGINMDYDRDVKILGAYEKYVENLNRLKRESDMIQNGTGAMSEWQIDVINKANEGGWSVQDIAENLQLDSDKVRETLTSFHYMIKTDVLDEESDDVYFNADKQEVPDTDIEDTTDINDAFDLTTTKPEKDFWEVEIDCVDACSKAKKSVNVFLSLKTRNKAMKYMQWAGAREWLAYLIGELKDGEYFIHDLHLPKQKASATLVNNVVESEYNNLSIVGVIHSHHEMGAGDEDRPSFSGHDAAFINSNHNLSLLAGRDRTTKGFKIVGIARTKTPCDAFIKVKAVVKPMKEEMSEEEKALHDEFKEKVFGGKTNSLKQDPFKGNTVLGNKVDGNGNYRCSSGVGVKV